MMSQAGFTERPFADTTHLHVLLNPVATRAAQLEGPLLALENDQKLKDKHGIDTISVMPTFKDYPDTLDFVKELGAHESIAVAAGDGGHGAVLRAAIETGMTQHIALIGAGRKRDVYKELNPAYRGTSPRSVLMKARGTLLHPLEVRLYAPGQPEQIEYAAGYFSAGASGTVAVEVNSSENRAAAAERNALQQAIAEQRMAWSSVRNASPITLGGAHRGSYIELVHLNGRRMAGQQLSRHALLKTGAVYEHVRMSERRSLVTNASAIFGALARISTGRAAQFDGHTQLGYVFQSKAQGQINGEGLAIPAGSTVRVRVAEQGIPVTTTRLWV